uniref:5-methylcytosine-specific restriction enzyme B n=1 Tax=Aliivibrio wodanis TaxID=80852 RepID=A0A5Q4YXY1_9GAMM|nr:5-methylcytosine-specific restriction enzyme B [Aliivibrio wodanis]
MNLGAYIYGVNHIDFKVNQTKKYNFFGVIPEKGSEIYLFKTREPQGIFAKVRVIEIKNNEVHFEVLEKRELSNQVPAFVLKRYFSNEHWPKGYVCMLHTQLIVYEKLSILWEESKNSHGIEQILMQLPIRMEAGSWYQKYSFFTQWFKSLDGEYSDEDLIKIWSGSSDISSISPQHISPEQCLDNIDLLRDITVKIVNSPTSLTHSEVKKIWREQSTFPSVLHVAINRVFAMTDPSLFTSAVSEGNYFPKLYRFLAPMLGIQSRYSDWVSGNIAFKTKLNALLKNQDDIKINIELWGLIEYLETNSDIELVLEGPRNEQYGQIINSKDEQMNSQNLTTLNQILYGPPGTGKTYTTINKALQIIAPDFYLENKDNREKLKARFDELLNNNRIGFVTFHQSFSYEDFVEGLKASTGEDKQINYDVEDGIFKSMCNSVSEKLLTNINEKRVLIIDEINRGNISNIFGELITLIEPSKRSGGTESLSVKLPYSKETFSVPSNLHIIGTMNTADKSLAQLDIALRRRFEFVEMMTNYELLKGIPDIEGINVAKLIKTMNQRIELLYDREHTIGHSFFLPLLGNPSLQLLAEIFELQLLPLLEEYFFEDWERVGQVLGDHLKDNHELRFVIEQFGNSEIAELMGDDWEVQGIQPYCRNQEAFKNPQAYIGVYTR